MRGGGGGDTDKSWKKNWMMVCFEGRRKVVEQV